MRLEGEAAAKEYRKFQGWADEQEWSASGSDE